MSWHFSRALVEAFSEATSSVGARSALLSGSPTPPLFLPSDRMTAFSRLSRFGMTFGHLTDNLGAEVLMWCQAVSRARRTAAHLEDKLWRTISGRKCGGSWQMSLPGTYLPRTSTDAQSTAQPTNWKRWVTPSDAWKFPRQTWVLTTFGDGVGYLHTPTTIANFCAPSMQKHPSCRAWRLVFGEVSPWAFEYLMAWPEGWTDLKPLATGKCHSAPQQHGESLLAVKA